MTREHKEYLALVEELCQPAKGAYRWFEQVMETALLWDHVIDGDEIEAKRVNFVFNALTTEWVFNDFFHTNRALLVPVLVNCISAWKHSNISPSAKIKAYDIYTELPCVLALVIHGQEGVQRYMPRIREMMDRERWLDTRRDHPPFLIVGLPRSRTAWLAAFLTDGQVFCHHELLRSCANAELYPTVFLGNMKPIIGDSDPSLPLFYSKIKGQLPAHKVVFITRSPEECRDSTEKMLIEAGQDVAKHLAVWDQCLAAFLAMRKECPDAMAFNYEDLDDPEKVKELAEYCTGLPFNKDRWTLFNELKITALPEKVMANQRLLP